MFVQADESAIGQIALGLLPSFLRVAPVRLVDPARPFHAATADDPSSLGAWARYEVLYGTEMNGPMVNVVCTDPARWVWQQTITAPLRDDPNDPNVPTEKIEGWAELWTKSAIKNVLVLTNAGDVSPKQIEAASKYDRLIYPITTERQDDAFTPNWPLGYKPVTYVNIPVKNHALVREVLLP